MCVCVQGPGRGHRDVRLHQTGDPPSGLQFQELLHRDGTELAGEQSDEVVHTLNDVKQLKNQINDVISSSVVDVSSPSSVSMKQTY